MSPEEEIARAARAAAIIEDPLVVDALDAIRSAALHAWENSAPHDTEGRERAWHRLRAANEFRANLQSHVDTGKMAAKKSGE